VGRHAASDGSGRSLNGHRGSESITSVERVRGGSHGTYPDGGSVNRRYLG
jgi:hypothetical protein